MSWARYDDELPMNQKVGRLIGRGQVGLAALGLHLLANTWSRHNGTAGIIEAHVPNSLAGPQGRKLARLLAEVGMFDDRSDGGWEIHDFAEFHDPNDPEPNKSAAQRKKELSKVRAEAGRKGGKAKAAKQTSSKATDLLDDERAGQSQIEVKSDGDERDLNISRFRQLSDQQTPDQGERLAKGVAKPWHSSSPVPVPVPTTESSSTTPPPTHGSIAGGEGVSIEAVVIEAGRRYARAEAIQGSAKSEDGLAKWKTKQLLENRQAIADDIAEHPQATLAVLADAALGNRRGLAAFEPPATEPAEPEQHLSRAEREALIDSNKTDTEET